MRNTITVNFGGFYCSMHEQLIESMLEQYYSDDTGSVLDYYSLDIPYKTIFAEYSEFYLDCFTEWLSDEYDLNIKLQFSELWSPREYNFSTDEIIAFMTLADENKLNQYFKKEPAFIEYLKKATKSYDGYISFYDYEKALNNEKGILSTYVFTYLCQIFNETEFFTYYDKNNGYELIYNIDLPQLESEGA